VIVVCGLIAIGASIYLVIVLEILKLRRERFRQLVARWGTAPPPEEVDESVALELETGSFQAINPETGERDMLDPETGEFEAIDPDTIESETRPP
jgi:hypothetical protein